MSAKTVKSAERFEVGDRVKLSGFAARQGVKYQDLGSNLATVAKVFHDGMLHVVVDGRDEPPLYYHPDFWEPYRHGGSRPR